MIFPLSPLEYGLSILIVAVGSILQGSVGFGLGLLAVPLLILIDPAFVPGPLLLIAFFLNILVSYRERKEVDYQSLRWILPGRVIGTIIGASMFKLLPESFFTFLFGFLILLAVVITASGLKVAFLRRNLLSIGLLSGFMATTVAVGGPPIALLYQKASGTRLRGTLAALFIVGTTLSISALIIIGKFGVKELLLALSTVPGVVLGYLFSSKTARILDRGYLRPAVLIASSLSALIVIIRGLM